MIIAVVLAVVTSIQQSTAYSISNATLTPLTTTEVSSAIEDLMPESVVPNGTLIVSHNGNNNLYGSTVKLRQSRAVLGDWYTIIIDTKNSLPAGVLRNFYLFIEQKQQSTSPSYLWLQIWRQYPNYDNQYQLVWRRRVYMNDSSPHALYTFNVSSDEFQVKEGDYIGWTGLDNKRFISRDDDTPCNDCSHSRTIVDDDEHREFWVPSVRETPYERIRPSNRQFFFSAAVRIDRPKATRISSPPSVATVSSILQPIVSSTSFSGVRKVTLSTTTTRIIINTDDTIATTVGIVFGIFGAVIVAIAAVVIWKKRDYCKPAAIWSALKTRWKTQDSRVELLESGSSTTGSTEHGDDVDSSSVTTSSSSEMSGVAGRRDRDISLAAPVERPRHSTGVHGLTDRAQDPVIGSASRPTYSKYERSAHDNDGFVNDDVMKSAQNNQSYPVQQQQKPVTSKAADARTHCVSVELHSAPRKSTGPHPGSVYLI